MVAVLWLGCGARSSLEDHAALDRDSPVADASADAARLDASTDSGRDGGVVGDASVDSSFDGFDAGDSPTTCLRDADCERGRCRLAARFAPADLTPAPLVCGEDGPGAEEGAFCDDGAGCARGLCVVAGSCVAPCVDDGDCAEGERCAPVYVQTAPSALQTLSACVARLDLPAGVDATRMSLGRLRGSARIEVPGVRRRALYVYETMGALLWPVRLQTQARVPELLFELEALGPGAPGPRNGVAPGTVPLTLLVPNSSASVATPAGYLFDLAVDGAADVVMTRIERRRGVGRVLDLDLFYVGATGLVPSGDRGPPRIRDALVDAARLLRLTFGEIRQHDVVGGLRRRLEVLEADAAEDLPELPELFSLSAGVGRPSVAVFFVRDMETALGVSGGLPGPWGMHGVEGSGIAIAADVLEDFDTTIADVMAHELGHFLGLFHTTELDGTVFDPLPTTPSCPPENDTDGDGLLLPEECDGLDGDNLMFWAGAGRRLVPEQRALVRSAFVLR